MLKARRRATGRGGVTEASSTQHFDKGLLFGGEGRHGGAERRGRAGLWCRVHFKQTAEEGQSCETLELSNVCFLWPALYQCCFCWCFRFRESWSFLLSGGDGHPSKYNWCSSARNNENNNSVSLVAPAASPLVLRVNCVFFAGTWLKRSSQLVPGIFSFVHDALNKGS